MGNSWENPKNKNQSTGKDIENLFREMGDFKESYKKGFLENSFRIDALEAGTPIKKHDVQKKSFIEKEIVSYAKAISGKSYNEFAKDFENYKIPEISQLANRDTNSGKLMFNAQEVENYKYATAFAPLAKEGVRDFRNAKKFEIKTNPSGRISFSTDLQLAHEKLSYDLEKLFLSMLSESEDGDKEFSIQPYAHIDEKRQLTEKSLLVLSNEQRVKFRKFMVDNIKI